LHPIFEGQGKDTLFANLTVDWPPGEVEAFVDQILGVFDREGLDLLHFHYALPFAAIVGEVHNRLEPAGPLVIGTLHGTDVSFYGCHPQKGPQLAQELKHLDGLTTVSFSHAVLAAQVFGLPELPAVIPNFVDLSRFRPGSLRTPGLQAGNRRKFRIVHISNYRAVKNPRGLAHIFLGILEQQEAELWLVGHGPETPWLKTFFQEQGLHHNVRFWGPQRHVAPILAQSDLLLMPSLAESFCLAALEALACGVPVLAAEVGGLPEVVVHGSNGLLFPPEEPLAAVDLAVHLLSNPLRHLAMREAALRNAQAYGQGKIVTEYENYYHSLMNRPRRRGLSPVEPAGYSFAGTSVDPSNSSLPASGLD
jgi:N-acetyl-alpha-D-glucosaminyl L-malate synthase BshA